MTLKGQRLVIIGGTSGIGLATAKAAAAPVRRVGRPEEVAQTVLHLMANTFTTGSTLYVDGGYLLR